MRVKSTILLALLLAIGSIAAACGSDDGDGDTEPASGSDRAAEVDDGGPEAIPDDDAGSSSEAASGAEARIERAVRAFLKAAASGDGDRACGLLSEEGRASVEGSLAPGSGGPESCEEAFELIAEVSGGDSIQIGGEQVPVSELDSLELEVEVAADGRSAEVLAEGSPQPATAVREGGEWKLNWN